MKKKCNKKEPNMLVVTYLLDFKPPDIQKTTMMNYMITMYELLVTHE